MITQLSEQSFALAFPKVATSLRDKYLSPLNNAMTRHDINTPVRMAAFLAQVAHESGGFRLVEENLNYSEQGLLGVFSKYFTVEEAKMYARNPEKIANRVYANRMGNGDEASGDGWRFRGRGLIQLTGRNNYTEFAKVQQFRNGETVVQALERITGWLTTPEGACESAGWFWSQNNLNAIADKEDLKLLTKRINGGLNGYDDRLKYYNQACKAFGISST